MENGRADAGKLATMPLTMSHDDERAVTEVEADESHEGRGEAHAFPLQGARALQQGAQRIVRRHQRLEHVGAWRRAGGQDLGTGHASGRDKRTHQESAAQ